jgi:hypothetical protein
LFIGQKSLVADAYGVKTDKEFVNTLQDKISERGSMDMLISAGVRAEASEHLKGFSALWLFQIGRVNHIIRTKTLQRIGMVPSRLLPTMLYTYRVHLLLRSVGYLL